MVRLTGAKELSKGIFWFTCKFLEEESKIFCDFSESEMIYLNILCDLDGNSEGKIVGNSKDGSSFTHKNTWNELAVNKQKDIKSKSWNYFPRGRVEVFGGKIKVFYNPNIEGYNSFKSRILTEFGLGSFSDRIQWIVDNSNHYSCFADIG